MQNSNPIVVGVDGTETTPSTIQYAAAMAKRYGSDLRLVHVVPQAARTGGLYAIVPDYFEAAGARILRDAVKVAEQVIEPTRVHPLLKHGTRVSTLLNESQDARAVVLGFDSRSSLERLATGSTVAGVASRCPAEVVVVPLVSAPHAEQEAVAVGIKDITGSAELLREAFEVAAERAAHLRIIHAAGLPNGYEDLVDTQQQNAIYARFTEQIRGTAGQIAKHHPDVVYDVQVVHGQAARVLAKTSASVDLLMVERRRHPLLMGHLGGTARALLRASQCPVHIMPPAEAAARTRRATAEAVTAAPE